MCDMNGQRKLASAPATRERWGLSREVSRDMPALLATKNGIEGKRGRLIVEIEHNRKTDRFSEHDSSNRGYVRSCLPFQVGSATFRALNEFAAEVFEK